MTSSAAQYTWAGRFSEPVSDLVKRYTASVDFDRRLVEGVRPRRRADVARFVGQRQLGAVGVEAWHEVDGARVQQRGGLAAGVAVTAVMRQQPVQPVQVQTQLPVPHYSLLHLRK